MEINRVIRRALPLAAAALFLAAPVFAKKPAVTCDQIQTELKAGKSAAAVAKDLHVSTKRVHSCTGSSTKSK